MTWSSNGLIEMLDVAAHGSRFVGQTRPTGQGHPPVAEGPAVLAQAIVAAAKRVPDKTAQSVSAVFAHAVVLGAPVDFTVEVVREGHSTATAVVSAEQEGRRCATVTVLSGSSSAKGPERRAPGMTTGPLTDADESSAQPAGREHVLVDVVDLDGDASAQTHLWWHRESFPSRDDLTKAVLAYVTGHLCISSTQRDHRRREAPRGHDAAWQAPVTVGVSFHEPVSWDGWLSCTYGCVRANGGPTRVCGAVRTAHGELIAAFTYDGLGSDRQHGDATDVRAVGEPGPVTSAEPAVRSPRPRFD
jgi:acyl-CoA thioesterase-2